MNTNSNFNNNDSFANPGVLQCPNCGTISTAGKAFCRACGTKLVALETSAPDPFGTSAPTQPDMINAGAAAPAEPFGYGAPTPPNPANVNVPVPPTNPFNEAPPAEPDFSNITKPVSFDEFDKSIPPQPGAVDIAEIPQIDSFDEDTSSQFELFDVDSPSEAGSAQETPLEFAGMDLSGTSQIGYSGTDNFSDFAPPEEEISSQVDLGSTSVPTSGLKQTKPFEVHIPSEDTPFEESSTASATPFAAVSAETPVFDSFDNSSFANSKNVSTGESFTSIPAPDDTEEEEEDYDEIHSALADGLPAWSLVPPQTAVRRRKK